MPASPLLKVAETKALLTGMPQLSMTCAETVAGRAVVAKKLLAGESGATINCVAVQPGTVFAGECGWSGGLDHDSDGNARPRRRRPRR